MSWSTNVGPVAKGAIEVNSPAYASDVFDEQSDQFEAAVDAARALAKAVGRPEDEVYVTLSGHANPEHGPRPGWADEMITVSISARPKADVPEQSTNA
jgi:hypothetical protein